MNKEKIKWLNFLLKFHSLNLHELKYPEHIQLADKLDYFIHNDIISIQGTTIKNLVILDPGEGYEYDHTDLPLRGEILIEIKKIQNEFRLDITSLIELIETAGSNAASFKLDRKFYTRQLVSAEGGKICLTEGTGHTINEILLFKFQKYLANVSISFFNKCPECGVWFVNATKRVKTYCTNKCATRFLMREKRQEEKLAKSEKYIKDLEKGSKRARKSYVKKIQQGNPNIKVASRPTKHKKEG